MTLCVRACVRGCEQERGCEYSGKFYRKVLIHNYYSIVNSIDFATGKCVNTKRCDKIYFIQSEHNHSQTISIGGGGVVRHIFLCLAFLYYMAVRSSLFLLNDAKVKKKQEHKKTIKTITNEDIKNLLLLVDCVDDFVMG